MAWDCRIGFRLNLFNVLILKVLLIGQWSILLLGIFCTNHHLVQSAFVDCDQVHNCLCYRPEGEDLYEIQCPNEPLSVFPITLKVHPWASRDKPGEGTVQIICDYDKEDFDWRLIHGLDLGKEGLTINKISIKHCPLPSKNDSLTELFKHINIDPGSITSFGFISLREIELIPDSMLSSMVNLTELDLSQNSLVSMPRLSYFKNLRTLHIHTNKIVNITKDTFINNDHLQHLQISRNDLTVIQDGSLPDSLVYLNLVANKLSKVTNETFSNLKSLKYLWLSANRLDEMHPNAFSSLSQLRELKLDTSEFKHFPHLDHLPLLANVSMSYNRYFQSLSLAIDRTTTTTETLTTMSSDDQYEMSTTSNFPIGNRSEKSRNVVKSESKTTSTTESVIRRMNKNNNSSTMTMGEYQGIISDLPSLFKLVLANDGLRALPVFTNLPNLTSLFLNLNQISIVPTDAFAHLNSLKILDLSRNKITSVGDIQATSLTDLDLSRNSITIIERSVFGNLANLKKLNLGKNKIEYIDPNAFESLTLLEDIDLSDNRINFASPPPLGRGLVSDIHLRMGSSPLRFCRSLKTINLSYNLNEIIYNDFTTILLAVTQLDLSHNKLATLTVGDVDFIQDRINVDLSFNEITTINMNYFDVRLDGNAGNNVTIKLEGNPLYCNCSLLKFKLFNLKRIEFRTEGLRCTGPILPKNLTDVSFQSVDVEDLLCPVPESKGCPEICDCWLRPWNKIIIVDCEERFNSTPKIFPTVNNFTNEFKSYGFILNLSDNGITDVPERFVKDLSTRIRVVDLRMNKLRSLSFMRFLNENNVTKFNLSENQFPCLDCSFHTDSRSHFSRISDSDSLTCQLEDSSRIETHKAFDYDYESICATPPVVSIVVPIVVLLFCFAITSIAYIRHGWAIRAFLYSKGFGRFICDNYLEDDEEKLYDAFVSYSHRDEEWVLDELVNRLEEQEGFKLCLHFRDWTAGDWIPDQIVRSVDQSRRTVVILSKNFVESVWSRLEFKAAHSQALTSRANRLILVLMDDELTDVQDDDLRVYMKMNTYIKWNDPWFWHKLKYALPHRKCTLEENRNHFTKKIQRDRAIQLDKMREKMENQIPA